MCEYEINKKLNKIQVYSAYSFHLVRFILQMYLLHGYLGSKVKIRKCFKSPDLLVDGAD